MLSLAEEGQNPHLATKNYPRDGVDRVHPSSSVNPRRELQIADQKSENLFPLPHEVIHAKHREEFLWSLPFFFFLPRLVVVGKAFAVVEVASQEEIPFEEGRVATVKLEIHLQLEVGIPLATTELRVREQISTALVVAFDFAGAGWPAAYAKALVLRPQRGTWARVV